MLKPYLLANVGSNSKQLMKASIMPSISIIVPVYNAEKYLEACLESLENQSLNDIEIICIDDGSTDESFEILKRHAQKDTRLRLYAQENAGVSAARNRGLDLVQGRYVMFVDSDDMIAQNTCEILMNEVQKHQSEIVVFAGKTFPTTKWKDACWASRTVHYGSSESVFALFNEPGSIPLMCNKLYAASLLKRTHARFNTNLKLGEDHAFQMNIFPFAHGISYLNECLYFYRGHNESAVNQANKDWDEQARLHLNIVKYVIESWQKLNIIAKYNEQLLRWVSDFFFDAARRCSFNTRKEVGAELKSLLHDTFDSALESTLDDTQWHNLHYIIDTPDVCEKQPLIAFVYTRIAEEQLSETVLLSALTQYEQRIEVRIDSRYKTPDIEALVNNDERASFFDEKDAPSLLDSIKSPYLIFAQSTSEYMEGCVNHIFDRLHMINHKRMCAQQGIKPTPIVRESYVRGENIFPADVVIFDDSAKIIRTEDPFFALTPNYQLSYSSEKVYSYKALSKRVYNVASLSFENKAYRVAFLKQHAALAQTENDNSIASFALNACVSLPHAQSILLMDIALLVTHSLSIKRASAAQSYGQRVVDMLQNLARIVEAHTAQHVDANAIEGTAEHTFESTFGVTAGASASASARTAGFYTALASYLLSLDDTINSFKTYEEIFPFMQEYACSIKDKLAASSWEDRNEIAQWNSLCTFSAQEHFNTKSNLHVDRLTEANTQTLSDLSAAWGNVARLNSIVDDFNHSISYKTGRVVTFPLRYMYYNIQKLIRR